MSQIPHTSPFDGIRHEDENGTEFWSARELFKLLGYTLWEKFQKSIEEAKIACENSNQAISDHFHLEVKMIVTGKGAKRKTEDYHFSRSACYLIVQLVSPLLILLRPDLNILAEPFQGLFPIGEPLTWL